MNKYVLLLVAAIGFCAFTAKSQTSIRNINLTGLVVDAETLVPLDSAKIVDGDNRILGFTDKTGYYKVTIAYNKDGAMHFNLKVMKKGFDNLNQNEHWGDL